MRYAGIRKHPDTHTITLDDVADGVDLEEGDVIEAGSDGLELADPGAQRVYVVGKPPVEGASGDELQVKAREATANVADGVEKYDYVLPDGGEFRTVDDGEAEETSTMQVLEEPQDGRASVLFG